MSGETTESEGKESKKKSTSKDSSGSVSVEKKKKKKSSKSKKSSGEKSSKRGKKDSALTRWKERQDKLDVVGSTPMVESPGTLKQRKNLEEKKAAKKKKSKERSKKSSSKRDLKESLTKMSQMSIDDNLREMKVLDDTEDGVMGLNDSQTEGFVGLNDSQGTTNDNDDPNPGWSKSSRALIEKEKRRQASLGRHQERKKSTREFRQKNKSVKVRTKGVRTALKNEEEFKLPVFEKSQEERDFIKESLQNDFIFKNLEHSDFQMFADAFEEVRYEKGETIIREGTSGDYFYIVSDGRVRFSVEGKRVGSGQRGRSFGEAALLYAAPRTATVVANSQPTKLFRVDQQTFRFITHSKARELRQQKLELLRTIDFMDDLLNEDLQRLSDLMVSRTVRKGSYLYEKDADADAFYILYSGELKATDIVVGDTVFEDIKIEPGDYFGQNALARDVPRENSIVAIEDSCVYGIDRSTFDKVLGSLYNVILKTNDRQLLSHIKVIRDLNLDPYQLVSLTEQVTEVNFGEGEIIMLEGEEVEPALYLIREGTVEISLASGGGANVVQEDVYFGDDIFLSKRSRVPAQYTVKALEDVTCGCLTLKACQLVFGTTDVLRKDEYEEEFGGNQLIELSLSGNAAMKRRSTLTQSFANETLSIEDLERIKIVGEGEYGEVWLTKCAKIDEYFALKIQLLENDGESYFDNIKREVAVMTTLYHPYIVGMIASKFTGNECFIVMDFIAGGELWSVIHRETNGVWTSGISEADAKFYSLIIADTISYMHRRNILFRDLKPENVMIDNEGYPNLIDFGFAKITSDKTYTFCGTPNYVAPEIVLNAGHSVGADHWALGVVIYEMLSGENPFWYEGIDTMTLYEIIVKDEPYPMECKVSASVEDLVDGLLEKDPSQRLGVLAGKDRDILFHSWYDGLDLQKLRAKEIKAPWLPPTKVI